MNTERCKCGKIIEPGYRGLCEDCTANMWANQDVDVYKEEDLKGPDTPIRDLGLDGRTVGILWDANFKTVADIEKKTDQELLQINGIGPFLVLKIRKAVGMLKISLIPDEDEKEVPNDYEGLDKGEIIESI